MKTLFFLVVLAASSFSYAVDTELKFEGVTAALIKEVSTLYSQGKYQKVIERLNELKQSEESVAIKAFVTYWQALSQKKLMQYNLALQSFTQARALGHSAKDFSYEFAQTAYAQENWELAQAEFRRSIAEGFKVAVCHYYLATIKQDQERLAEAETELKKALALTDAESREVHQPAQILLGDIYLQQVRKSEQVKDGVADVVVPQYRRALAVDENSELAPVIKEKIKKVRQEYRLAVFELINGRSTVEPRHVLKLSQEFSQDSNVTFSPANTTVAKSKQQSAYSKTDVFARYTFYYRNYLSFAPGARFNYTRYFNREPEIYRNDNQLLSPSLNLAYEHKVNDKPAATLFDYDYSDVRRDVNSEEKLEFSARTHTISLGEKFRWYHHNDTTVRLRWRQLESYLASSDSKTLSLSAEQLVSIKDHLLVFMTSYDRTRVNDAVFDTDALMVRSDYFGPSIKGVITPSAGLGLTVTDPINARSTRGTELLVNPSLRFSHAPMQGLRVSAKADYQNYDSKDEDNFAYRKFIWGLEIDYLF
jgi:hypothetical protein